MAKKQKLTKLTPEQESRLVEFREEWLRHGLSCDPADFEAGDRIIRGFYARLKKPEPIILHFSSPAMCEMAVNLVFAMLAKEDSQLYSQLDSQLDSQLRSQLYSQLYSQLRSQLYSQLDSLKPYFLRNYWCAQHSCWFEAFYLFGEEIGVQYEASRNQGTSIEIIVSGANSSGYNEALLKAKQTFQKGNQSDIASIILARLSDEHALKLRLLKTELANLEAGF